MLYYRLVYGITDTTIQKCLLAEKYLTLDKAISLAQSVETSKDSQTPTWTTTELQS